ncbi:hypothetical protein [Polaribacter sp. Q13]|uniref:hypothetical protein n=1 Tax=Polaribacter sp. Q13 TaxID=2806551 RepID=UPI00193B461A|nr:hypothetical protein [Polaribacter sp. Q13]QVY64413.1 hypothetical protein JOP69_11605 [Polaribacter sp. Q13]
MNFKNIFILFCATVLFSCENNETIIESDNLLIGFWVAPIYDGETITFTRTNSLPTDSYGFSFIKDQKANFVTERTSGFCGTPPLTFFDRQGTWELNSNNLKIYDINITNQFGAEPVLWYNYQILEISETELVLEHIAVAQEIDHRNLMDLFNEIQNLSYSVSCSNAADWLITEYGAKACGGPQGFIAYSSSIDTVSFLQKIETYTQAEKDFNFKYGVVSDCSIPSAPISVECQNGFPVFTY